MVANIVTFKHRITCAGTAVEKKTMDHFTERVNNLSWKIHQGENFAATVA
jgi:hypothetical protein